MQLKASKQRSLDSLLIRSFNLFDLPDAVVSIMLPSILGIGALALALLSEGARANATLLVLVALIPLLSWLHVPGDTVRRSSSTHYMLIVAAAGLHGLFAAVAVGLIGFAFERNQPLQFQSNTRIQRIAAYAAITTVAYGIAASPAPDPIVNAVALTAWIGFTIYWLARSRRHGAHFLPYLIMLGWFIVMMTIPLWFPSTPNQVQDYLEAGFAPIGFALWFMTLDTALVTALGIAHAGQAGIQFWQRELVPTFTRYTALSLGGAILVVAFGAGGFPVFLLMLALAVVALLIVRDRVLSERKLIATICALTTALDARDPYTKGHSDRVAAFSVAIAARLGWLTRERRNLEVAAHLHDVGKIGIPDAILLEPGRLNDEQFAIIKTHAEVSAAIVRNIPDFQQISRIIHQHHERLNGSGYPLGVAGDRIFPAARVLSVADSFDAMTSNRPYRQAMEPEAAIDEIASLAGTHYDPTVVDVLESLFRDDDLEAALQFGYCLTH